MKSVIVVLIIIVLFGILTIKSLNGKHNSFVKLEKCFDLPTESIISIKISNNNFKRILEKEIVNPSKFQTEFASIVKKHYTKIEENVVANTVYTDEITISTEKGIYKFKFEHPLPGKGLIEFTIENGIQKQALIEIDNKGGEKIRALLDKMLGLSSDNKENMNQ